MNSRGSAVFESDISCGIPQAQHLLDHISDAVITTDLDFVILSWNRGAEQIYGWTAEEAVGQPMAAVLPTDYREEARESVIRQFAEQGEWRGLVGQPHKNGRALSIFSAVSWLTDTAGERIGTIGVNRDVTESQNLYRNLFEIGHTVKLLIDPDTGAIEDANSEACRFYGYPKSTLVSMNIADINQLSKEEIHREMNNARTERRKYFNFSHRLAGGEIRQVEVYSGPIQLGNRTLLYSIIHDVTDLKAKEAERRLLAQAVEQSANSIVITDVDGNIEYVNPFFTQVSGYSSEEALGQNPRVLKSGATSDNEYEQLWKKISSGRQWTGRFQNKRKNGEFYWEKATIAPVLDATGNISHYIAIKEDITQQIQAEADLQESEERFRSLTEHSPAGVYIVDREHRFVLVNPSLADIFGYTVEEMAGKLVSDVVYPQDRSLVHAKLEERFTGKVEVARYELRGQRKDGSILNAEVLGAIHEHDGERVVIGTLIDITSQRKALNALAESEDRLEEAQRVARLGSWDWKVENNEITLSDQAYRIFGFEPQSSDLNPEHILDYLHPEDRDDVDQTVLAALSAQSTFNLDARILLASGEQRDVNVSGEATHGAEGQLVGMFGTVQDITDRKAIELELRIKDKAIASAVTAIAISNLDGELMYVNQASLDLWRYTKRDDILGRPITSFFVFEEEAQHVIEETLAEGSYVGEMLVQLGDQSYATFEVTSNLVTDESGKVISLVAFFDDVTERNRASQRVKDSELRYRRLIENLHSGLIVHAADTRILLHNERAAELLGLPNGELANRVAKDEIWQFFREDGSVMPVDEYPIMRVLNSGNPILDYQLGVHRPDLNRMIWALVNAFPEFDQFGEILHVVVSFVDVTAQKEAADALKIDKTQLEDRVLQRTLELEEAKLQIEAVFDSSADGILLFDLKRGIMRANATCDSLLGMPYEAYRGRIFRSLILQDDVERVNQAILQVQGGDSVGPIHVQILRKETYFDAELYFSPVQHLETADSQVVCTIRDVTEQNLAAIERRRTAALLQKIADNYPNSYLSIIEPDFTVGFTAGQEFSKTGMDPNHFVGMALKEVFGEHTEFVRQHFQQTFQGHETTFELFINNQFQFYRTVPLTAEDGSVPRILSLAENITERKLSELALQESEKRFRVLAENVSDLIARLTPTGKIIYSTPSSDFILGYSSVEMAGRFITDFILEEDQAMVQAEFQRLINGEHPQKISFRAVRKDGRTVWLETQAQAIRNQYTGVVEEVVASSRDVSERIERELHLNVLSKRLQLATEASRIGVWDWNFRTGTMVWDDRMLEIYGISRADFAGDNSVFDELVAPEDRVKTEALMEEAIENQTLLNSVFRIRTLAGEEKHIEVRAQVRYDEDGEPINMIGVNMDVTDIRNAELALLSALEKERELGELKSRFVSMASHEFRTPLTGILATVDILTQYRHRLDDEKIDVRLDKIRQQVLRMTEMIEDVLDLARIQAGRTRFEPAYENLNALVIEIVEEFNAQEAFRGRVDFRSNTPIVKTAYDRQLMRQILSNLIHNGLKYSADGAPVYVELTKTGSQIKLSAKDQGIGIPEEDLAHLYEPFHRASNVGNISGTGLGLSISKRAVEAHGGELKLETEAGVGSTFTIVLPVKGDPNRL